MTTKGALRKKSFQYTSYKWTRDIDFVDKYGDIPFNWLLSLLGMFWGAHVCDNGYNATEPNMSVRWGNINYENSPQGSYKNNTTTT